MTAADLERLDVPLAELIRRVDSITAEKRATSAAGAAAENRHLLYDADPDATIPAFVDLHHHTSTRRRTS